MDIANLIKKSVKQTGEIKYFINDVILKNP